MRYLVTGGAGFIGSHLVERLLKDGHFVRVLDNFSSGKPENLSFTSGPSSANFELITGDVRDFDTCLEACRDIDYVLHQAALRSVPKSMSQPQEYNQVNINGTVNMLKAAREGQARRLVFASSSSVYGDIDVFPEKEDFLPAPISPYALTKLTGEYYCRIFSEHFGLETVALRYFNVFGPRQSLDDEYAVVIPKFIHCLLHDQQPPIFGTGKQSRDFTYVENVVAANILAATAAVAFAGSNGRVFHAVLNVANGQDNTVLELATRLNKIIGKNIKPQLLPIRQGDVFKTNADISKIKRVLGFSPQIDFSEGLERTVSYFKQAWGRE